MATKSSFTRKSTKKQAPSLPLGTIPSVQNGQLLISTGLYELDEIFSGGIPVGTLFLVEEDEHTSHYSALMKYFLAEGLAVGHHVTLVSSSDRPGDFLHNLPRNLTREIREEKELSARNQSQPSDSKTQDQGEQPSLTIAWQYQKYLTSDAKSSGRPSSSPNDIFCHSFDLGKPIQTDYITRESVDVVTINSCADDNEQSYHLLKVNGEEIYLNLYQKLYTIISNGFTSDIAASDSETRKNILRIGIQSLGGPTWHDYSHKSMRSLLMFLHALRGMLRSSLASCLITVPAHILSHIRKKIENLCDSAVCLESFEGRGGQVSDAFRDFDGQLFVKKLPKLNSMLSPVPETLNYVFKMKRRKLHIEILRLGPEESRSTKPNDAAKSSKDSSKNVLSMMCNPGSSNKSNLDF